MRIRHVPSILQSVVLAAGLLFAWPGPARAADAQADAATLDAATLDVSGAEYIKGLKRVAITQFEVQFVTHHVGNAAAASSFGLAKAALATELRSVEPAQMQAIVDTYYDRVAAELSAAGIEVVPLAQLQANADFLGLKEKGYPAPFAQAPVNRDGLSIKGTFYTAHELPVYFVNDRAETAGRGKGRVNYLELGTIMSSGFKVSYAEAYERAISKAFDAHILRVRMTLPFADMLATGGLFTTFAKVAMKTGLRLDAVASRYELLEGGARIARIGLKSDFNLPAALGRLDESVRDRPYFVVDGAEYVEAIGNHLLSAHKAFQSAILSRR